MYKKCIVLLYITHRLPNGYRYSFAVYFPASLKIGGPGRNRTGTPLRARDFKSLSATAYTMILL
jgi:hypothetical protein